MKACQVDEQEVARTLAAFDPIWEVLHNPEKERILRLLIEKATYDAGTEEMSITFRPTGIAVLATEVGTSEQIP